MSLLTQFAKPARFRECQQGYEISIRHEPGGVLHSNERQILKSGTQPAHSQLKRSDFTCERERVRLMGR